MQTKTMIKHLEALDKKVITKSDINAFCRFLNGLRYDSENRVKRDFSELLIDLVNSESKKITKDQNEFGRQWLINRYVNKKGQPRKQLEHDFSFYECKLYGPEEYFRVITNLKDFRFIGFTGQWNSYARMYVDIKPVYQAIAKDGTSFNYCFGHWGKLIEGPEIITTLF